MQNRYPSGKPDKLTSLAGISSGKLTWLAGISPHVCSQEIHRLISGPATRTPQVELGSVEKVRMEVGTRQRIGSDNFLPLNLLQQTHSKNRSAAHKIVVVFFDFFLFGILVTHTDEYHQHDYFVVSFPICCKFICVFEHAVSSGFLLSLFFGAFEFGALPNSLKSHWMLMAFISR